MSNHLLASTLSNALVTPSSLSKNSSVYILSVSGPTLFSWASTTNSGFIASTAAAAVCDLSFYNNRTIFYKIAIIIIQA